MRTRVRDWKYSPSYPLPPAATPCRYPLTPTCSPNPVLAQVTANKGRQSPYTLRPGFGATYTF